ncbi:TRAP transporter small permease [Marinobacterium rhizophilum]|uniref:TRAP transporter small permease protein n=1 Tax=Marinobacterium rhizophilum TaxID=420402 RepID=A0ABY5HJH8_9GAMM|nr:TRAP transporter small permease [Marinobacterium rhizophilum]UTW11733.1 TRAP transporter small permease [Marinobacterium rhizophilum]
MSERVLEGAPAAEASAASPLVRRYVQMLKAADGLSYGLIALAMTLMTGLVTAQVVLRYFFGDSLDWADEMSRLAFVWSIFLALPHGVRKGIHVGIDILINRFGSAVRESLMRLMLALSGGLMLLVMWQGVLVAREAWGEMMPTVELSVSAFYIAVIVSMAHAFLHLAFLVWQGTDAWGEE